MSEYAPGQKLLPMWHGVQLALFVFLISTQVLDLCLQRIEWLVPRHRSSGDDAADVMVFSYRLDDIDKLTPCVVIAIHQLLANSHYRRHR